METNTGYTLSEKITLYSLTIANTSGALYMLMDRDNDILRVGASLSLCISLLLSYGLRDDYKQGKNSI